MATTMKIGKLSIMLIVAAVVVLAILFVFLYKRPPAQKIEKEVATPRDFTPVIFYTSNTKVAVYGNFTFKYPAGFKILSDEIKNFGEKKRHVIIFVDVEDPKGVVEVNMGNCSDYSFCREVEGVTFGTNSSSQASRRAVEVMAATLKVDSIFPSLPSSSQQIKK